MELNAVSTVRNKRSTSLCVVQQRSSGNCLLNLYPLLNGATMTAFLLQISHTTVLC
jgi:hypothetical protein